MLKRRDDSHYPPSFVFDPKAKKMRVFSHGRDGAIIETVADYDPGALAMVVDGWFGDEDERP